MTEIPPPPPGFQIVPAPPPGFVLAPQQAPIDASQLDRRTGAPASIRAAVGAASTPRDRLATLQKTYPDARPYEDDNFVFTDPATGRLTLYNPPGLMPDLGDLASIGPEVAEFTGAVIGGTAAAVPAVLSAVPTGGQSLMRVPVATGLGAAAGREAFNLYAQPMMGTVDTRGLGERTTDAAATAGMNAVGVRVGDLVTQGVRNVAGPVVNRMVGGGRAGQQALDDFAASGITPSAGAVTGNRAIQQVEQGLANTPGGARVMQDMANRQTDQAAAQADELVRGFATGGGRNPGGAAGTVQEAGATIRGAANEAVERFNARQAELYDGAFALVGERTPVSLPNTLRLAQETIAELGDAALSRQPTLGPVLNRMQSLLTDAQASGGLPFDALRRIRTDLGRELKQPMLGQSNGAQQESLRRLYGALTEDMNAAARAAGPEAARALALADRYTRYNLNVAIPTLQKIARLDADEKAFGYALSGAKDGGSRLLTLRRNFSPEEWDTIAASVLNRMGAPNPGQGGATALGQQADDFSVNKFLTDWRKISPEAQRALFSGRRYARLEQELNTFVRVVDRLKDAEKMANPSGTARNLLSGGSIGAAGTLAATGDVTGAISVLVGTNVAPYLTARLMSSPRFVRWLTDTAHLVPRDPNARSVQMARLATIAEANPEIREELLRFRAAVRGPEVPIR